MKVIISLSDTFHCAKERAFKAPILGDATKFLNGYLFQPPIIAFEEDETWGQINGFRYPFTAGNFWTPKGRLVTDVTLERIENQYWKWMILEFKVPFLFFVDKGIGEWIVEEKHANEIFVKYKYTYFPKHTVYYIVLWLFCQIQVKGLMKQAIKGIRKQAESGDAFVYK